MLLVTSNLYNSKNVAGTLTRFSRMQRLFLTFKKKKKKKENSQISVSETELLFLQNNESDERRNYFMF